MPIKNADTTFREIEIELKGYLYLPSAEDAKEIVIDQNMSVLGINMILTCWLFDQEPLILQVQDKSHSRKQDGNIR